MSKKEGTRTTSRNRIILIVAVLIAAALVTVLLPLLIRVFLLEAFKVPSGAMMPTILPGDHILVSKLSREPERKDIVVFRYPKDPTKNFIKRIVAIGGDSLEIRNKKLYLNEELIEEPYVIYLDDQVLPANLTRRDNFGPIRVPEGKYFTLGDNRDNSHDSRYWGFVDREDVKGKALFIYWSWDGDKGEARFDRIGKAFN